VALRIHGGAPKLASAKEEDVEAGLLDLFQLCEERPQHRSCVAAEGLIGTLVNILTKSSRNLRRKPSPRWPTLPMGTTETEVRFCTLCSLQACVGKYEDPLRPLQACPSDACPLSEDCQDKHARVRSTKWGCTLTHTQHLCGLGQEPELWAVGSPGLLRSFMRGMGALGVRDAGLDCGRRSHPLAVRSLARDVGESRQAVALLLELSREPQSVRRRSGRCRGASFCWSPCSTPTTRKAAKDAAAVLEQLASNDQNVVQMAEANHFQAPGRAPHFRSVTPHVATRAAHRRRLLPVCPACRAPLCACFCSRIILTAARWASWASTLLGLWWACGGRHGDDAHRDGQRASRMSPTEQSKAALGAAGRGPAPGET